MRPGCKGALEMLSPKLDGWYGIMVKSGRHATGYTTTDLRSLLCARLTAIDRARVTTSIRCITGRAELQEQN